MKTLKIIILTALIVIASATAETGRTGTTAVNSLKLGVDARIMAMGGAGTALNGNSMSLFWNPANLGELTAPEAGFMLNRYVLDMRHSFLAIGTTIDDSWRIGMSLSYFSSGDITETVRVAPGEFSEIGTYSLTDITPVFTVAYRFNSFWSVGGSVKPVFESMGEENGQTAAFDLGLLHQSSRLAVGAAVRNLGPPFTLVHEVYPLPVIMSVGASYRLLPPLLLAADVELPFDNEANFKAGVEFSPFSVLDLRAGFLLGPNVGELSGQTGLTAGIGVSVLGVTLNYAYRPMDFMGAAHRISLHVATQNQQPPDLNLSASPRVLTISADSPEVLTVIDLDVQHCNRPDRWHVFVLDSNDEIFRRWQGRGMPPRQLTWDGRDTDGRRVAAGSYQVAAVVQCANQNLIDRQALQVKRQTPPEPVSAQPRIKSQQQKTTWENKVFTFGDILFDVNRANIRPDQTFRLQELLDFIKDHPRAGVIVAGHTDSRASNEYNMQLSLARANRVKNYILQHSNLPPDQIEAQGFGESQPIADNSTAAGRQQNRRVEVTVIYPQEAASAGNPLQNLNEIIEAVELAAFKYDQVVHTENPGFRSRLQTEAQQAEQHARRLARENGFQLIKLVIRDESTLYEVLNRSPEFETDHQWKRMYSVWRGQLSDLSSLHPGQTIFVLTIR